MKPPVAIGNGWIGQPDWPVYVAMEHACPGSIRNMAMTTTVGSRYKIVKFSERWRTVRIVVKNSTFTVRKKQIRTCLMRLARSSRAVAPRRVHWSCMHLHAAGHRSDVKDSCHWFIQFFAPVQSLWKTAHHSREHGNNGQKTQTIETRNRNFERADHCALRAATKKERPAFAGRSHHRHCRRIAPRVELSR